MAWSVDHPPPRAVQDIAYVETVAPGWRPVAASVAAAAAAPGKNVGQPRSADSSMSIAWLNTQSLRNKTAIVCETVADKSLDVLALTETWHSGSDDVCLRLATPTGNAVVDVARNSARGGGVAVIFRIVWHRGVHGDGDGGNPRVFRGCAYECCGNTAGMDLTMRDSRGDGFYYGGNPALNHLRNIMI